MKTLLLLAILLMMAVACNNKTENKEQKENGQTTANTSAVEPVTPQQKRIEDFIPKGWKEILNESGDLNKDGINDSVIVIENTNPRNLKLNDGLGSDTLNLNPRNLLIFFKQKEGGYILAAENNKGFIPAQNSDENPCLADPLMENGGIRIKNGVLKIDFQYWLSCGSWEVSNVTYTFRYQNNRFDLIGFDISSYHRSSGEETGTSINFMTKKKSETTGGNMFDESKNNPHTTWTTLNMAKIYSLQNCTDTTYFEIQDIQ